MQEEWKADLRSHLGNLSACWCHQLTSEHERKNRFGGFHGKSGIWKKIRDGDVTWEVYPEK